MSYGIGERAAGQRLFVYQGGHTPHVGNRAEHRQARQSACGTRARQSAINQIDRDTSTNEDHQAQHHGEDEKRPFARGRWFAANFGRHGQREVRNLQTGGDGFFAQACGDLVGNFFFGRAILFQGA